MSERESVYAIALRRAEEELDRLDKRRAELLAIAETLRHQLYSDEPVCTIVVPERMLADLLSPEQPDPEAA